MSDKCDALPDLFFQIPVGRFLAFHLRTVNKRTGKVCYVLPCYLALEIQSGMYSSYTSILYSLQGRLTHKQEVFRDEMKLEIKDDIE